MSQLSLPVGPANVTETQDTDVCIMVRLKFGTDYCSILL
jgi:hypothetical protein